MVGLKTYAQRLEWAMKARGVSVAKLATVLDFTPNGVKKALQGGKRGTSEMFASNHSKTAKYLKVNPDWLATGEGEPDLPAWAFGPAALELARAIEALHDEGLKMKVAGWLADKIDDAAELLRRFPTSALPTQEPAADQGTPPEGHPDDTSATTSGGKAPAGRGGPRKKSARRGRAG